MSTVGGARSETWPCPYGCGAEFAFEWAVNEHLAAIHHVQTIPVGGASSEPTGDRLAEIRRAWGCALPNDGGYDEIDWLISEVERLRVAAGILQKLVDLKDGPHDSMYLRLKPKAWEEARTWLAGR